MPDSVGAIDPERLKEVARMRLPGDSAGRSTSAGAIHEALLWLAREQKADGTWGGTGVTALAVLAFLECGAASRPACRRGLDALVALQDPEGCIGKRDELKYLYGHLIATRALWVAGGYREAARRAVGFTLDAQNRGQGWRYSHRCGDNDPMVTGFALLALREAQRSGFPVPEAAWNGARKCFDEATWEHFPDKRHKHLEYRYNGSKMSGIGKWQPFAHPLTGTAMGLLVRTILDGPPDEARAAAERELVECTRAGWNTGPVDFVSGYLCATAFREHRGILGEFWPEWRHWTLRAILPLQDGSADPGLRGSWEPCDAWGAEGGRVYATAMNALTLALCAKR